MRNYIHYVLILYLLNQLSVTVKKALIVLIAVYLCSCSNLTSEEKMVKNALGKTVNIEVFKAVVQEGEEMEFHKLRNKYDFIYLIYLKDGCNPCYPKFIEWQERMSKLEIGTSCTVLFVIEAKTYKDFLVKVLDFDPTYNPKSNTFYIIMDSDLKLLRNNRAINPWIFYKSILLDSNNKIRLIGPPFASKRMHELFNQIISE